MPQPQDPGIGTGVGGLFASLINPGLATRVAQHITPNPNPLAQQGQPAPPGAVDSLGNPVGGGGAPAASLAPPATTQPDPTVAANAAKLTQPDPSYAADMMRYQRVSALSDDLNRNIQGVAAGFGTAEQQRSKQAALGGGTVGGGLADLAGIQRMQDQTIQNNEHARFMANAQVFAQTMSQSLGRPVSVVEATEMMNNPDTMHAITQAMGSNMTQTEQIKNWEQARAAMRAMGKSEAEINAAMPPELLAFGGGADLSQTQYLQAKALATSQGKGADFPDFETWKNQHAQAAKETEDAHKVALALPGLKSQLTTMDQRADTIAAADPNVIKGIMSSTSKQSAASQIFNWDGKGQDPAILYGNGKALTTEETTFVQNARQLHLANYASNFKDATPGQRLSQQEAARLGSAADQLGNFTGTADDYMSRINDVKNRIGHAMGNAHGEARDLDSLPIQYRSKIDPSFIEGPNALKNLPTWAQPKQVANEADLDALPYGQAYKPTTGKYAGKILFKGQEAGYEDY
jgi:hypothetical protein